MRQYNYQSIGFSSDMDKSISGESVIMAMKKIPKEITVLPQEEDLLEIELKARKKAMSSPILISLISLYASIKIFGLYLISTNGVIGCTLTIGSTIYAHYATKHKYPLWNGAMDWALLSFVLVMPMAASINMAFRRREQALVDIAIFRSCSYQLYMAHACWDWSSEVRGGRISDGHDWLLHSDEALHQLVHMGNDLHRYLTLPNSHRVWHRVTKAGKLEAAEIRTVSNQLYDSLLTNRLSKITRLTEVLKRSGLPANEASRIRQWELMLGQAVEDLRMLKTYRTPQALRAFARVFSIFLPPFYSPSYAQVAHDIDSLAFGIVFGMLTSLALTALFESIRVLEDPFVATITLDGIDVREELSLLQCDLLLKARKSIYPNVVDLSDLHSDIFQPQQMDAIVTHI